MKVWPALDPVTCCRTAVPDWSLVSALAETPVWCIVQYTLLISHIIKLNNYQIKVSFSPLSLCLHTCTQTCMLSISLCLFSPSFRESANWRLLAKAMQRLDSFRQTVGVGASLCLSEWGIKDIWLQNRNDLQSEWHMHGKVKLEPLLMMDISFKNHKRSVHAAP